MLPKSTKQQESALTEKEVVTNPIARDMESLNKAGTMQLRTIAKVLHIKNYSRLGRENLIFAIVNKKQELWKTQQMELWQ